MNKYVVKLTPADFDEIKSWKLKRNKCCFVMFYLNGCKWCEETKVVWNKLAKTVTFYTIAAYECDTYPEHFQRIMKDVPHLIDGYPTLVVYKEGEPVHVYEGDRTFEKLLNVCIKACK